MLHQVHHWILAGVEIALHDLFVFESSVEAPPDKKQNRHSWESWHRNINQWSNSKIEDQKTHSREQYITAMTISVSNDY